MTPQGTPLYLTVTPRQGNATHYRVVGWKVSGEVALPFVLPLVVFSQTLTARVFREEAGAKSDYSYTAENPL